MTHFTSEEITPRDKVLNYIRCFARLYNPQTDNEHEARTMAAMFSYGEKATC